MGVDGGEDIAGVVLVRFLYVRVFFLVASNVMSLLSFLFLLSEPGAEAVLTPASSSPTSTPPCGAVSELAMSLAFFWAFSSVCSSAVHLCMYNAVLVTYLHQKPRKKNLLLLL